MKIKLVSDFTDYYDHWFDQEIEPKVMSGEDFDIFRRVSTTGLPRRECLQLLLSHGYDVPAFGEVTSLLSKTRKPSHLHTIQKVSDECTHLVVYTDEKAHCGDGKVLVTREEALAKYPEHWAMEYIPEPKGVSWRYLQFGYERFWLEYRSNEDWRSNRGDTIWCEVFCREEPLLHPTITMPLFAIDFVPGKKFWAVDFNIAPGTRGSGIERMLPPKLAHETLVRAYQTLKPWILHRLW